MRGKGGQGANLDKVPSHPRVPAPFEKVLHFERQLVLSVSENSARAWFLDPIPTGSQILRHEARALVSGPLPASAPFSSRLATISFARSSLFRKLAQFFGRAIQVEGSVAC